MENREYGEVIGNRSAPYINRLARRYALARGYYAITHPSLPNYLALTGGQTFGISSDCTDCVARGPNIADQLEHTGRSWRAYMEDLPRACSQVADAGGYGKKHDPFLYYPAIAGNSSRCRQVVPLSALRRDLRKGRLPDFVWITPNLCDDGHDCSLSTADRFLAALLPSVLSQLGRHGFLVLTWDEGASDQGCCSLAHGGHVATILVGRSVRHHYQAAGSYDHYSVLRTVEDAFGLPHLAQAGCPCTQGLDALFAAPPRGLPAARAPSRRGR
jgi:hypothetical protein